MKKEHEKTAIKALLKAIKLAGSQVNLAKICGANVRQGHIQNWLRRNKRKGLPAEYVLLVEQAFPNKISRYELRPDVFK